MLRPGGRLLVVDFAPHEQEFLREQFAHRRLGFAPDTVTQWITASGLDPVMHKSLAPEPRAAPRLPSEIMALCSTASDAAFTVTIVERQPLLHGQGPWAWLLVGLAATPAVFLWDRVARRIGDLNALLAAFALPLFGLASIDGLSEGSAYSAAFLFYVVQYFVIFFCNTALVGAAMIRLRGGDPPVPIRAAGRPGPLLRPGPLVLKVGGIGMARFGAGFDTWPAPPTSRQRIEMGICSRRYCVAAWR